MHQEHTINLYTQIFNKLGKKWLNLIADLRKAAEKDDPDQIFLNDFIRITRKYGIKLSDSERQNLLYAYPGRDEGVHVRINIYPMYDQKYNIMAQKVYEDINVRDPDKKDEAVDACGYKGEFHRKPRDLNPLSELEWITHITKNDHLKEVFIKIREIDKQRNGFVTELELDDILKIVYPGLDEFNLKPIILPFCCRENKILVDYKKFRMHVQKQMQAFKESGTII